MKQVTYDYHNILSITRKGPLMNGLKENKTIANTSNPQEPVVKNRRAFLKKAGKFAVYTPPAMMMLMHPSANAVMKSAIGRCNNGVGNGPDYLPPGIEMNGKHYLDNDDHGGVPGHPQNRGGFR